MSNIYEDFQDNMEVRAGAARKGFGSCSVEGCFNACSVIPCEGCELGDLYLLWRLEQVLWIPGRERETQQETARLIVRKASWRCTSRAALRSSCSACRLSVNRIRGSLSNPCRTVSFFGSPDVSRSFSTQTHERSQPSQSHSSTLLTVSWYIIAYPQLTLSHLLSHRMTTTWRHWAAFFPGMKMRSERATS